MSDNNPIDNYFKNSLEGHEVKASPEVWERVVAETEAKQKRGMAWVFMRAAVVVLMFSLGTWYTFDYSGSDSGAAEGQTTVVDGKPEATSNKTEPANKGATPTDPTKATKRETEEETKRKKVMPIMKQRQPTTPIYVSREYLSEVDEVSLYEEDFALATIELDRGQLSAYDQSKPSMKLQLNQPVTESAFYGEGSEAEKEENKDLKTKLYAYANSQFDNIKNGRPVELPRTGKPQLQINLNRIFNN